MTLSETQASRHPVFSDRCRSVLLRWLRASPHYPDHLPCMPCPLPRWIESVLIGWLWCVPAPGSSRFALAFPAHTSGRHPQLYVSRLAQASLALRPTVLLAHLKWTLSRGSSPDSSPSEPLASYPVIPISPGVGLSPTGDLRHRGARARHDSGCCQRSQPGSAPGTRGDSRVFAGPGEYAAVAACWTWPPRPPNRMKT